MVKCPFCGSTDFVIDVSVTVPCKVEDGKLKPIKSWSSDDAVKQLDINAEKKGFCYGCGRENIAIEYKDGELIPVKM